MLVKVALDLLGVHCSKNLRLHGMIETSQRVSIRFDSDCKDGTQWRGQFVIAESAWRWHSGAEDSESRTASGR